MEYSKCLAQVDEVLKYLEPEALRKIPHDIIDLIKDKKDKEYIWTYDITKNLEEQKLDRKSIAILSYLNMQYLLNDEQRNWMKKMHRLNEQKQEEQRKRKFNSQDIFNNNIENKPKENYYIIKKTTKDNWYTKILLYIRSLFHKKS